MDFLTQTTLFQSATPYVMKSVGTIFCLVYLAIESVILYSLYHILLPYYSSDQNYSAISLAIIWIEAVVATLTIFNYFMAACNSPGYSKDYSEILTSRFSSLAGNTGVRYCEICEISKPSNVHHCSICKKYVVKLDHHCPWIMNCVGYKNTKYFLLFLFYACMGCLLHTVIAIKPFKELNISSDYPTLEMATMLSGILASILFFFNIWSWGVALTDNSVITMLQRDGKVTLRGFFSRFRKDLILQNMMIHFQTKNPLIAILPSFKKPSEDPFVEEYERLNPATNAESVSVQNIPKDVFINIE